MVYMVSQNSNQWKYKYRLSCPKAGHIPHHNSWCSSIHETHVCVGAAWEVNHRKNGWTNERTVSVFYSPFVAVFRMKTHCWIDETTQNEKREMLFFLMADTIDTTEQGTCHTGIAEVLRLRSATSTPGRTEFPWCKNMKIKLSRACARNGGCDTRWWWWWRWISRMIAWS